MILKQACACITSIAGYYDPQTGRFLNSDEQLGLNQDLLSYNLFAYCGNNPINRLDPSGLLWGEIKNFFNKAANAVVSTVQNISTHGFKLGKFSVDYNFILAKQYI
jgi:RHS repeat-associated protein